MNTSAEKDGPIPGYITQMTDEELASALRYARQDEERVQRRIRHLLAEARHRESKA